MKPKKILFMVFLIIWMLLIFFFSNQPANISEENSDAVASKAIETVSSITKQKITESKKKDIIKNTRFLVRKLAHITLYFILNLLAYFTLKNFSIKYNYLYSILFCFFFACTDEFHQLFIAERAGRILDVLIDTSGAIFSCLCIYLVKKIMNRRKLVN